MPENLKALEERLKILEDELQHQKCITVSSILILNEMDWIEDWMIILFVERRVRWL